MKSKLFILLLLFIVGCRKDSVTMDDFVGCYEGKYNNTASVTKLKMTYGASTVLAIYPVMDCDNPGSWILYNFDTKKVWQLNGNDTITYNGEPKNVADVIIVDMELSGKQLYFSIKMGTDVTEFTGQKR